MERVLAILAINSGSSSLKFKLFSDTHPLRLLASGNVTGIGSDKGSCTITPSHGPPFSYGDIVLKSTSEATIPILEWIKQQQHYNITSIGHRIVHGGMKYSEPTLIDDEMINELKKLKPSAPSHTQAALSVITTFKQAFPSTPQIACFDTHFHKEMPFEAKHYALPKSLWTEGVIKYGFHGLSCEYIIGQLEQMDSSIVNQKTIVAHLGSSCSMTAVKGRKSIDTTMGFTPAGDMVISTRAGDIDPGDINQLLQVEQTDIRTRQAINMFCYHARKHIGALAAAMGGLDTLVFTGGIGEHHHRIRIRICTDLEFLGIRINDVLNRQSFPVISGSYSKVTVYVIKTNEEVVIAGHVRRYIESHRDHLIKEYGNADPGKNETDPSLLAGGQIPGRRTDLFTE